MLTAKGQRGTIKNPSGGFEKQRRRTLPRHNIASGTATKEGVGVNKDEQEAIKWYRKAVEQGFGPAKAPLDKLLHQ